MSNRVGNYRLKRNHNFVIKSDWLENRLILTDEVWWVRRDFYNDCQIDVLQRNHQSWSGESVCRFAKKKDKYVTTVLMVWLINLTVYSRWYSFSLLTGSRIDLTLRRVDSSETGNHDNPQVMFSSRVSYINLYCSCYMLQSDVLLIINSHVSTYGNYTIVSTRPRRACRNFFM